MSGWQLSGDAPTLYDQYGLIAIKPWTDHLIREAQCHEGDHVLDIACGTGYVAKRDARFYLCEQRRGWPVRAQMALIPIGFSDDRPCSRCRPRRRPEIYDLDCTALQVVGPLVPWPVPRACAAGDDTGDANGGSTSRAAGIKSLPARCPGFLRLAGSALDRRFRRPRSAAY
jgi:hypothetical protein